MTRILHHLNSFAMILLVSITCLAENLAMQKTGHDREAHYEISIMNIDYALVAYTFMATDSVLKMSSRGAD